MGLLALLAPEVSLSAIVRHVAFVTHALLAMAAGSALGCALLGRRGAPVATLVATAALAPAAALLATASRTASVAPRPALALLLPASRLLPAGVLLGAMVVEVIRRRGSIKGARRTE